MQYRANGSTEISALFNQEGDELKRAGFSEPDLSEQPDGYNGRDQTSLHPFSTVREATRLGIDLETALEG